MDKDAHEISEAELEVLKVLWDADKPLTAQEVCDAVPGRRWKYTTVSTLLSRLTLKNAVAHEKVGKAYHYYPVIKKEDYSQKQIKSFVSKMYDGSVKKLAVSLFETGEMSAQDIEEIRKMFDL